MRLLDDLESGAKPVLEGSSPLASLSDESRVIGRNLMECLGELRDFLASLKPSAEDEDQGSGEDDDPADSIRRRIEGREWWLTD